MPGPEYTPNDPMVVLKHAKYALNAGDAEYSLYLASQAADLAHAQEDDRVHAFGIHRAGLAQRALGQTLVATDSLVLARDRLLDLSEPDHLAKGIVERDLALHIAVSDKSRDGRSEARELHDLATRSHATANEQTPESQRVELEARTTLAHLHRLDALENRFETAPLWGDVAAIKEQRDGDKKLNYEYLALLWALNYERRTGTIIKSLPRAAFLATQMGNIGALPGLSLKPAIRYASNLLDT